jgi:hypothetical protein
VGLIAMELGMPSSPTFSLFEAAEYSKFDQTTKSSSNPGTNPYSHPLSWATKETPSISAYVGGLVRRSQSTLL